MTMNATPLANRVHIGIFGRRNAGKSSLINALTGQNLAIVSEIKGTTTDPVFKSMELLPLGPVVMIDTPGLDDEGALGEQRIQKGMQVLGKTDIALLVISADEGVTPKDEELLAAIREKKIPYLLVWNKCDEGKVPEIPLAYAKDSLCVSALTGWNITALKDKIAVLSPDAGVDKPILADLLSPSDFVVLVVPIDKAAPKGRLILPQQQTIRDILEANAVSIVVKENELANTLKTLGKTPRMVVTDSQAFALVAAVTPDEIPLTSFSILFARYKGYLEASVRGISAVESLKDGDTVLIAEGCTHHRQCGDIGSVKIPNWLKTHTGKDIHFAFSSGTEFPQDLSPYRLVIHCGGCMLNEREVIFRMNRSLSQNTPFLNYGILIAYLQGILPRAVRPFPDIARLLG